MSPRRRILSKRKATPREAGPLPWILEPFMERADFGSKRMFGHVALYLRGRLCLLVGAGSQEPWNGMMVATSKEHHEGLRKRAPALEPHPVLGKWLYISQTHPDFEATVSQVQALLQRNDVRIGVEPRARK